MKFLSLVKRHQQIYLQTPPSESAIDCTSGSTICTLFPPIFLITHLLVFLAHLPHLIPHFLLVFFPLHPIIVTHEPQFPSRSLPFHPHALDCWLMSVFLVLLVVIFPTLFSHLFGPWRWNKYISVSATTPCSDQCTFLPKIQLTTNGQSNLPHAAWSFPSSYF